MYAGCILMTLPKDFITIPDFSVGLSWMFHACSKWISSFLQNSRIH